MNHHIASALTEGTLKNIFLLLPSFPPSLRKFKTKIVFTKPLPRKIYYRFLFVGVVASMTLYGPQQAAMRSRPSGQMGVPHLVWRWAIFIL